MMMKIWIVIRLFLTVMSRMSDERCTIVIVVVISIVIIIEIIQTFRIATIITIFIVVAVVGKSFGLIIIIEKSSLFSVIIHGNIIIISSSESIFFRAFRSGFTRSQVAVVLSCV